MSEQSIGSTFKLFYDSNLDLSKVLINKTVMTDLPQRSSAPLSDLQDILGLLRLLEALDSAPAPAPSSLLQRSVTGIAGNFGPPAFGHQTPRNASDRDRAPPAPQVTVYDLSEIPAQDREMEVALLIALDLSGGLTQIMAPSDVLRRRDSRRLRRRAGTRNLRREPWTLEGLGLGRRGIANRAGLGPESQGSLHDRVADIMDATVADIAEGRGGDPVVSMRHWSRGAD